MEIIYNWEITAMEVILNQDGLSNVVSNIDWRLIATVEGERYKAEKWAKQYVSSPNADAFFSSPLGLGAHHAPRCDRCLSHPPAVAIHIVYAHGVMVALALIAQTLVIPAHRSTSLTGVLTAIVAVALTFGSPTIGTRPQLVVPSFHRLPPRVEVDILTRIVRHASSRPQPWA